MEVYDPAYIQRRVCADSDKVVLVLVGLPARGKSYISKKTSIYLNWLGLRARTFNVGNHRRNVLTDTPQTSSFFDGSNADAAAMRHQLAMAVLDDLLTWLTEEGDVALFDATNTTRSRREAIVSRVKRHSPSIRVVFIESICDDPAVLQSNFEQKIANSPDYRNMPHEEAVADLRRRIANYEQVYEPVDDDRKSYIKLINLQSKIVCNRIFGRIEHQIASYLMCLNIVRRKIFLTRSGEAASVAAGNEDSVALMQALRRTKSGRFTVDPTSRDKAPQDVTRTAPLSERGRLFAAQLASLVQRQVDNCSENLVVYTSTVNRAIETAEAVPSAGTHAWPALNMLDTGLLHGKSIYEIARDNASVLAEFAKDPFRYRPPGGESFEDVVRRLTLFVVELERLSQSALVVAHLTTLQALYGYFFGLPGREFCDVRIPPHTVIELVHTQYGWEETRHDLSDPAAMLPPELLPYAERYKAMTANGKPE